MSEYRPFKCCPEMLMTLTFDSRHTEGLFAGQSAVDRTPLKSVMPKGDVLYKGYTQTGCYYS